MTRKLYEVGGVTLGWIVANFLGVAAIQALVFIYPFLTFIPRRLLSTLIIGLPIGFAQWVALRRVAPISVLWVLTIPAGLLLVVEGGQILDGIWGFAADDDSVLAMTVFAVNIGLVFGLVQWLFLWRHFAKSGIWLLGSAVGLGLGLGLVLVSDLIDYGLVSIIVVTFVYALATGLVISWFRASRIKTTSNLINAN
jgi:hypothetical protein